MLGLWLNWIWSGRPWWSSGIIEIVAGTGVALKISTTSECLTVAQQVCKQSMFNVSVGTHPTMMWAGLVRYTQAEQTCGLSGALGYLSYLWLCMSVYGVSHRIFT